MKLTPFYSRVLVKLEEKDKTDSGIIVTAQNDAHKYGMVVAFGQGKLLDNGDYAPIPLKVGDKVMFRDYGQQKPMKDGEDKLLIIEDIDVLAIVE